jgi:uncharacterized protein involved in exopolysaccharide biosynthesis
MEMDSSPKQLHDYLDILRRRRWQMAIPAALLLVVSALIAFGYPPSYRSTATILIEEQEVPPDLVRSTVTSYADQRIQSIKQQIMSRTNLWKIVEQYGLYARLRERASTEEVLKRMVDDIDVKVISAEVVDRRTGQSTNATIAFTLSYDGETPALGQKVANELTSLFLAENLRSRQRHAQETTAFLKQEAGELAGRIDALEKRIAAFKRRAGGALPELLQLNMQLLDRTERDLSEVDQQVRSLEERKIYLEGVLATMKPNTPIVTSSGERILDSGERLKALSAQYVSSGSYLAPGHPDMIKMKKEIEALQRDTGSGPGVDEMQKRLTGERARLATLRDRYGDDHPDVLRSQRTISALDREILQAAETPTPPVSPAPENPAYITLQAQLASTVNDLDALRAKRVELQAVQQRYSVRVESTPTIERDYLDLTRDRDNSVAKYHEIRSKLLEAQVSEGLEAQRKGERFSLIDPPLLPEKPITPNRPAIVILGFIVSMAGGVGYGAAVESLDHSVRSAGALERIVRVSPLAVIPFVPNAEDRTRALRRKRRFVWGGLGATLILLALVHALWLPLDVIWFAALRKLGF